MGGAGIITGIYTARSGLTLLGRVLGNNGRPITVATIASIGYNVRDLTTQTNLAVGALSPAAVLFDSLQQADPRWDKDSATRPGKDGAWGYNFLATLPAAQFATLQDVDMVNSQVNPHRCRVDLAFAPVAGEPFRQAFEFTPITTWG